MVFLMFIHLNIWERRQRNLENPSFHPKYEREQKIEHFSTNDQDIILKLCLYNCHCSSVQVPR